MAMVHDGQAVSSTDDCYRNPYPLRAGWQWRCRESLLSKITVSWTGSLDFKQFGGRQRQLLESGAPLREF
jgi:hypothetical protein